MVISFSWFRYFSLGKLYSSEAADFDSSHRNGNVSVSISFESVNPTNERKVTDVRMLRAPSIYVR